MREQYWNMYQKLEYQFFYYKRFQILFHRINWFITAICSTLALSSVATWSIWKTIPVFWSVLICASQLIQALFPKLPYNDLLISTNFMLGELEKLLLDINHDWLALELFQYSEQEILGLIQKYECRYANLSSQFFSGTYLPEIEYCHKKAEVECLNYFKKFIVN